MCHSSVQRTVALLPRRVWPDHSCITLSTRTHTHSHTHTHTHTHTHGTEHAERRSSRTLLQDDPPGPYLPTTPESGSLHTRTHTHTHGKEHAEGRSSRTLPADHSWIRLSAHTHTHTHTERSTRRDAPPGPPGSYLPTTPASHSPHIHTHKHTHTRSGACGGTLLQDPTHNSYHADLNTATVDNFPSSWGSIKTHFKCAHMPLLH